MIVYVLIPFGAYLLGSVPFGLILCRVVKGVDIRQHGSGNIGATNAGRVGGFPFFAGTFLCDFGKGLGAVLAGAALAGPMRDGVSLDLLRVLYGLGAILGHTFPIYVRFKGGKAVATSFGVFVALAPWAALTAFGVWVVVAVVFRYSSLASMSAAAAAPISFALMQREAFGERLPVFLFAVAIAVLVIVRHRANIRRLLAGTENRFGTKR